VPSGESAISVMRFIMIMSRGSIGRGAALAAVSAKAGPARAATRMPAAKQAGQGRELSRIGFMFGPRQFEG
jgi:hypothetical protein